jgi:transposase
MAIVTVGIDLAKNVFAVHGVDEAGKPALVRPSVSRGKLLEMIAALPPCVIGMEACSGAHHWSREFEKFGHTASDGTKVCRSLSTLRKARQERCGRCRCHL